MARVSKKLKEITDIFEDNEIDEENFENLELDAVFIQQLNENASYIVDEREVGYVLHSLESIILSVIFAIMANCNTFVQIHLFMQKHYDWIDKHISFDCGLPSLSTVKRVIAFINPKELEELCRETLYTFLKNNEILYQDKLFKIEDIKSMDGKTANSSGRNTSKNGKISKTNGMSLYSVKNQFCEVTEFINEKTNEIPTGLELLKQVDIKSSIIVFDALNTQKATIEYIADRDAYYVAPIKGNHTLLEQGLIDYFEDNNLLNEAKLKGHHITIDKRNNAPDKREYIFTDDVDWIYQKNEWKDLKSIGVVIRTHTNKNGEVVTDKRYYISNIPFDKIEIISEAIRKEWSIENELHLYLDMVFKEDDNKCFVENSQKNLNIIRKFCLATLKIFKKTTKLSMESIRFNISMDFENEIKKVINSFYKN